MWLSGEGERRRNERSGKTLGAVNAPTISQAVLPAAVAYGAAALRLRRRPTALSFERAEYESQASPALACAYCRKPIDNQYWQIGNRPGCADCRVLALRQLANSTSSARFFGALRLGALAAVAGSVCWIIVSKVTGYEVGIVAIGVGWLVGKAVRKGAGGFGGTRYQVMAVLLTYAAIAFASLPSIFEALRESPTQGAATAAAAAALLCLIVQGS